MIVTKKTLEDPIIKEFVQARPGDPCFYCGEPLTVPFVEWTGMTAAQVSLHPPCAEKLGACLVSDGAEVQGKLGDPT